MRMAPKQDETNPGAHLNWQMTDTEIVQQHPEATCLVSPIQQTIWTNMRSAWWPGIPKANLSNLHYRLTCTTCPVLVSSVIIIILQHIKQQVCKFLGLVKAHLSLSTRDHMSHSQMFISSITPARRQFRTLQSGKASPFNVHGSLQHPLATGSTHHSHRRTPWGERSIQVAERTTKSRWTATDRDGSNIWEHRKKWHQGWSSFQKYSPWTCFSTVMRAAIPIKIPGVVQTNMHTHQDRRARISTVMRPNPRGNSDKHTPQDCRSRKTWERQ